MIRKADVKDLDRLDALSVQVVKDMEAKHITQWRKDYPRKVHFEADIARDALYVCTVEGEIAGVMAYYEENDAPYRDITWLRHKSMVIHRIFTDTRFQRMGIAAEMIYYAIDYAAKNGYESIKIDTHPSNYRMRAFLKKHQFQELDYIPSMHRIGYERLIEQGRMQRIVILGSSGTGKTTLAKMLGKKLRLPYLHLDTVYWDKNWTSIGKEAFTRKVRDFIKSHPKFVIDGNYANNETFMERLMIADTIILLEYSRQDSLQGIIAREAEYKHRYRSDMAEGCIEEIDQAFLHYVYGFAAKRRKMQAVMQSMRGKKHILRFKDRSSLMTWFARL